MRRHHRLLADGHGARALAPLFFSLAVATLVAFGTPSCASDEVLGVDLGPDASTTSTVPDAAIGTDAGGKCGNAVLDDGEGCDDGNTTSGDGCSSVCVVETTPSTACPGTMLTLSAPTPTTRTAKVSHDTSAGTTSFDSPTCGGGNGKDVVYAITSDVTGRARVKLDAKFDALLYARTQCATQASEISCKNVPIGGGKTEITFPVNQGQTTWVVVDGLGGTSGAFDLEVEIGVTSCGDGIAQYPEQCDDGNTAAGDGCSAACELETPMSAPGFCPGATFTIEGGRTVSFAGDLALQPKSTGGSIGCGGIGRDQVYAITPKVSGALSAELFGNYAESMIHVRGECYTSQTEIDCKEQPLPSTPVKTTFPVVANQTYYVFVDSVKTSVPSGLYTLNVALTTATCANGILETPEQCDDGNTTAGDGCAADCTLEPMPPSIETCPGMPIVFAGPADGPNTFTTTTSTASMTGDVKSCSNTIDSQSVKDAVYTFVAPYDGVLEGKVRGSFDAAIDIRTACVAEGVSGSAGSVACGDKVGGDGEEIVRTNITAGTTYMIVVEGSLPTANNAGVFTMDLTLTKAVCGNGVKEGTEVCDDSNTADGDGCDSTCKVEPPPATRTTCATAEPLALTESAPGVFTASAAGTNWNLPGGGAMAFPCGVTSGKEAYYTVTPPIDGVVVARSNGNYNISLGARTAATCPNPQTGQATGTGFLTCSNKSGGGDETISFVATANTTYWIIVDAGNNQFGSYTLDVRVQGESCGDGLVTGVEQCDDGNLTAGDGCSPTCTLEALAGTDTCPGHAVALTGTGDTPRFKVVTLSTAALASNYSGECEGSGRDGVIAVTSDIGGTLTAQLAASWASVLYARTTCNDSSSEVGTCKAFDPAKPSETVREVTAPVIPGVPVYLFVDGIGSASGPASLSLTVTP